MDRERGGDMLTRTMLKLDDQTPPASVTALVSVLHRVPGVLQAQLIAGSTCMVVAHDAAVLPVSLLEAARRTAVGATIAGSASSPTAAGVATVPNAAIPVRRALTIAAVLLLFLSLADVFIPRLSGNGYVLPLLLSFVWAFVIARAVLAHRK